MPDKRYLKQSGFSAFFQIIVVLLLVSSVAVFTGIVRNTDTSVFNKSKAATSISIPLGAAVSPAKLKEQAFSQALKSYGFRSVTAENEMKMGSLQPKEGVFSYGAADEIVNFAQQNGMQVHGHALVWHYALPAWVTEKERLGRLTKDEAKRILQNHIKTVATHFKGKVISWDVVNEALDVNGNYDNTIWYRTIGPEYIELAFRWAREADPTVKLYYNDYNIEDMGNARKAKSDGAFRLVKGLKDKGVPINGIGMQTHVAPDTFSSETNVRENMKRYAAIGLDVTISEMDVKIGTTTPTSDQLLKQEQTYALVARACAATPTCARFTTWGLTDKYTWLAQPESPLLFDVNYRPKKAYYTVKNILSPSSSASTMSVSSPTPKPILTTSPTQTPASINQQGVARYTLGILAAGSPVGGIYPKLEVVHKGAVIHSWDIKGDPQNGKFETYTYKFNSPAVATDIKLRFANDLRQGTEDRNIRIDKVYFDGILSEMESLYSTSGWKDGTGCSSGYLNTEWMICSGEVWVKR